MHRLGRQCGAFASLTSSVETRLNRQNISHKESMTGKIKEKSCIAQALLQHRLNRFYCFTLFCYTTPFTFMLFSGYFEPTDDFFSKMTDLRKIACKFLNMLHYYQILDSIFLLRHNRQVLYSFLVLIDSRPY